MSSSRITTIRRVIQLASFILVMYGAFWWGQVSVPLGKIQSQEPRTSQYARNRILWVSSKDSVLPMYMPFLACRFIAKGGLFKSCALHLLSENITWETSLKVVIPHLLWIVGLTLVFGRFWCGWGCPLGSITDTLNAIRRRLHVAAWTVPEWLDHFFRKLRHFLLYLSLAIAGLTLIPALGRSGANDALFLFCCQLCPARLTYPGLGGVNPCWTDTTSNLTLFMTVVGWGFFGFFLLGFFVPRLYCRICPVGALASYFNRAAFLRLEKEAEKCTFCGTCRRCCPVDIERVYQERRLAVVTDSQCTLCCRCVEACPEPECLKVKAFGGTVVRS